MYQSISQRNGVVILQNNDRTKYETMGAVERKKVVEGIRILHPSFSDALELIEECRTHSKISTEPLCMLVTGPPGSGKTTLQGDYASKHGKIVYHETGTKRTILSGRVPSPTTVKSLAEKLLSQLGDNFAHTGTIPQKTMRLINYIKDCQVELVMLDEFQHFVDPNKSKVLYDVADWFKTLIDETKVPFVLFGQMESKRVLQSNAQLKRRFAIHHHLDYFAYGTVEEKEDFRNLLMLIDEMLPFIEPSRLADEEMADKIYKTTSGLMDSIMKLIKKAAHIAIDENHDCIQMIDFARSFEFHHQFRCEMENPFLEEVDLDYSYGFDAEFVANL